ncbi:hypothetical protein SDC9_202417 [bioreactor metagenome]|uniref:Uncharacterized protein n=1 Tax=bioreactor metagenome TaxID=1076179 RepID=A0A645IV36_9ZZZZ
MDCVDVVDHAFRARHDGVFHVLLRAEEQVEDSGIVLHALLEVAVHHGQLVQVGQHGEISHEKGSSFVQMRTSSENEGGVLLIKQFDLL